MITIDRAEETAISLIGEWGDNDAKRIHRCFFAALGMEHKLSDTVRYMDGMSGRKYRYFINNYIAQTPNTRYLEIGSWRGSTACAAMWKNTCKITCIDNWTGFNFNNDVRDSFVFNVNQCLSNQIDFTMIEKNFREVDYNGIGSYNIYMFDGPHEYIDQYEAVLIAQPALDDRYLLIVDDWNQYDVRQGTHDALDYIGHRVVSSIIIRTRFDHEHPKIAFANSDWHNGYFIGLIDKNG